MKRPLTAEQIASNERLAQLMKLKPKAILKRDLARSRKLTKPMRVDLSRDLAEQPVGKIARNLRGCLGRYVPIRFPLNFKKMAFPRGERLVSDLQSPVRIRVDTQRGICSLVCRRHN